MIQFKQTPIGEIPDEWGVVRLGDVVEINKKSKDPTKAIPDDKFFYVDTESIEGGTGVIKTAKEIFGKDAPSRARRVIHQNDVIMSTVRPYLKAFAIVPEEYDNQMCSTGFAVLSCRKEILPHYLLYTLFSKAIIEQCSRMMVGGQYPALNQSQVKNLKLPRPPLPEQHRIAEILTTADTAIRKVDDAIAKTERLKRGLMQELLTKGIRHEEFKHSEVGRIPGGWEVAKVKKVIISYKNGIYKHRKYYGNGYPCIRRYNILNGYINTEDTPLVEVTSQELGEYGLKKGDIVVNRVNTPELVGKAGVVPQNLGKATFESENIRIRFDATKVFPNFFAIFTQTAKYKIQIRSFSKTAVAQATITQKDLDNLKIPLPPLQEQRRIAEIISTVDKKLELERKRKEKLGRIKKGLMNDLLTGKKRVKP